MRAMLAIALTASAALAACALRPVCVPIPPDTLRNFTTPIAERDDRDLYLRVFQQRDGQWHQCKTWLSRQFYF